MTDKWEWHDGWPFGKFWGYRGSVVLRVGLKWEARTDDAWRRFWFLKNAKRYVEESYAKA